MIKKNIHTYDKVKFDIHKISKDHFQSLVDFEYSVHE